MKILITGGGGFIARSLAEELGLDHDVTALTRAGLNLLDAEQVAGRLKSGRYDVVIHAATYDAAPKFSTKDPALVLENNLRMFFNIARNEDWFGKLIYFGSGAEFGREHWRPKMKEEDFDRHVPADPYGFSKYIMTRHALSSGKVINLRLFGVFGRYDDWRYRLIPNACCHAVFDRAIPIHRNNRYDFVDMEDLNKIVSWFVLYPSRHRVYNVCTGRAYDFLTLAEKVVAASLKPLQIQLQNPAPGIEYSGDNARLMTELADFSFRTMDASIAELYAWYDAYRERIDPDLLDGEGGSAGGPHEP